MVAAMAVRKGRMAATLSQPPAAFRAQARAQAAFVQIIESRAPFAAIAIETGFADQAHMSRATRALTGRTPAEWRRSIPFKTQTQAIA